jgi:hypothetical protein
VIKMGKWEYHTIKIRYDKKKHKNWVVEFAGKPALVGLDVILNAYGSGGWELISLDPERLEAIPGFGKWFIEPGGYRATFKRPAGGTSSGETDE